MTPLVAYDANAGTVTFQVADFLQVLLPGLISAASAALTLYVLWAGVRRLFRAVTESGGGSATPEAWPEWEGVRVEGASLLDDDSVILHTASGEDVRVTADEYRTLRHDFF